MRLPIESFLVLSACAFLIAAKNNALVENAVSSDPQVVKQWLHVA
jgi:hypothetical protein